MPNEIIKLTPEEFSNLKPINNQVIIRCPERKSLEENKSGIIIIKDAAMIPQYTMDDLAKNPSLKSTVESMSEADMLPRWGIVEKIPESLSFNYNGKLTERMDWKSTVEIREGVQVFFDYHSALFAPMYVVGDQRYWSLNYQSLIVAKDGDKVIMLNGYILFELVNEGLQSKWLELPKMINKKKGIIRYLGSKNKEYTNKNKYDDIDVNVGDMVVFRNETQCLLEAKGFQVFEEMDLRYTQRCDIYGIIN
jgi:co-chaperonin GroES (HSP10)